MAKSATSYNPRVIAKYTERENELRMQLGKETMAVTIAEQIAVSEYYKYNNFKRVPVKQCLNKHQCIMFRCITFALHSIPI